MKMSKDITKNFHKYSLFPDKSCSYLFSINTRELASAILLLLWYETPPQSDMQPMARKPVFLLLKL